MRKRVSKPSRPNPAVFQPLSAQDWSILKHDCAYFVKADRKAHHEERRDWRSMRKKNKPQTTVRSAEDPVSVENSPVQFTADSEPDPPTQIETTWLTGEVTNHRVLDGSYYNYNRATWNKLIQIQWMTDLRRKKKIRTRMWCRNYVHWEIPMKSVMKTNSSYV